MAFLTGPAEHMFILIRSSNPSRLLGCLKVVSKLDVSPERWTELWRADV
jgi:hypothetical protein